MISPLTGARLLVLSEVESTQDEMIRWLNTKGAEQPVGAVLARYQSKGRGRFARAWYSEAGQSLAVSMAFRAYADHPQPWLIGMSVAVAAAATLHCTLRWPNDLTFGTRKVGGVLTELVSDADGRRIPVVGLGININVNRFPKELAEVATNAGVSGATAGDPERLFTEIVARLATLPEPDSWSALAPIWAQLDATPGKRYLTADGAAAIALGIGPEGQLVAAVDGETVSILAAEAVFGPT